ncbi:hypothetical protein EMIHUDRAFT_47083, partial [Emiliania huxleyi CCMP1516]|uniref:SET domain-containing protein n=2 Tax=Emiliania huxleyi TaxID=2903 RepID=A0A0D3HZZ2_EMIH1
PSQVAGWGLFSHGSIERQELVTEYVGELVPRHFRDTSETLRKYRFNLNAAQVVDACPKGNMSRFANHSDKANCDTKIMTVRGDQHIGLYAKERIGRGEEIFFNYR